MHIGYEIDGLYRHKIHPKIRLSNSIFGFVLWDKKRKIWKFNLVYFLSEKSEERILAYFVLHPFKGVVRVDTGRGRSEARRLDSVCKTVSLCGVRFDWKSVCETGREKHKRIGLETGLESGKGKHQPNSWLSISEGTKLWTFLWFNRNSRILLLGFKFDFVSIFVFRCVMNRRNPTVASEPSEFRLN